MIEIIASSLSDTHQTAESVAEIVKSGDLILLVGDLGAGKTAFTQGFGASLGVKEAITSPTFTLARTYQGTLEIHHLDVYRLDNLSEVLDLDLPELLEDHATICIEWGEVVVPELPRDFLRIRIHLGHVEDIEDARVLEIEPVGPSWLSRNQELTEAWTQWTATDPGDL